MERVQVSLDQALAQETPAPEDTAFRTSVGPRPFIHPQGERACGCREGTGFQSIRAGAPVGFMERRRGEGSGASVSTPRLCTPANFPLWLSKRRSNALSPAEGAPLSGRCPVLDEAMTAGAERGATWDHVNLAFPGLGWLSGLPQGYPSPQASCACQGPGREDASGAEIKTVPGAGSARGKGRF